MGELVEAIHVTDKHNEESSMNLEKGFAGFGKMDEAVESAAVTDQHNEEAIGNNNDNKKTDNENVEMGKPIKTEVIYEEANNDIKKIRI